MIEPKIRNIRTLRVYISRIWGEKKPARIEPNFLAVDVRDV